MNEARKGNRTVAEIAFRAGGIAVLLLSFLAAWLLMDFQAFRSNPLPLPEQGLELRVEPGTPLRAIARRLADQGVLAHPYYLVVLARYLGLDARIQAGEYRLQGDTTPEELLEQLSSGKVVQYALTLVEGQTFREMMQRIAEDPHLLHTLEDTSPAAVMAAIGYPGLHPEGRFLPETYHFPAGTTDRAFLLRAYRAMDDFLARAWAQRDPDLPLKTPYEALILASIVEKETGLAAERPRIAGVFIRRLRRGMRLQSDPTIIYGLGERYDGDIRFRDLRTDTPYNTYTRDGLPPTPIAMPGKAAILAVLHPAAGEALYFVGRGDGSHVFSRTLVEHNRAVDRYQRKRK